MIAVSVDNLQGHGAVVERRGIHFPVLYDTSTQVPRTYEVYNRLGDGFVTPATYILDENGVIAWKYVASRTYDHASVSRILAQLRAVSQQ